jgi:threonylcarbamoyladenosine tRNA methylthiotransferase MtaB
VPLVRGSEKSLPVEQVVAEVRHRVSDGYKEVVLTGTKIGSYDYEGVSLKGLLEHILAETDIARLRLSSLQPQEIYPELIGLWRDSRLCPHFHLSLQSGSDGVLRRMKRRYCSSDYQRAASLIRALVPGAAITTDIIAGFLGETEEEFEESYNFCRQLGFARIHVFSYSPRRGTQAARLPQQVDAQVKKQRSQKMIALHKESAQNFRQQFTGNTMPVLWEKQSADGVWSGLTDNYIKVYTKSNEDLTNKLLPVKLVKLSGDGVWGETLTT